MRLLLYSPSMIGHPQVYCRVLADIFAAEGHDIVVAGAGDDPGWPLRHGALIPLRNHARVLFVNTRDYSASRQDNLRVEELRRLQADHAIESTLFIAADHFRNEFKLIACGEAPRLHGRTTGIFAETSEWYPREVDCGGAPRPPRGGTWRERIIWARDAVIRRQQSMVWFYEHDLIQQRAVDAVIVKDERITRKYGPPVFWMPEIYKVFEPGEGMATPAALPHDMQSFILRGGADNVLLYFGAGAYYKGYDSFLQLALMDKTSFALHAGAPLSGRDRARMTIDVDHAREVLRCEGRLYETGSYMADEGQVATLFQTITRFVSTHRLTLSSGTMLQALDTGRPVLTAASGQVGYRTKMHGLGRTYRYGDAEDLRKQWVHFRREPVDRYNAAITAYMHRFSRDEVAQFFRRMLVENGR